ncbi:HAMP domain-containing sensor histidine kinase [Asticcacaulis sp. ZE23SCel15]|uniref:sensor histidine kinase n=1 Tax=Asticcacaulis sp. ZE23SCel15 TaxID=3059027 RepID=UPI00266039E1|nr:HAMP domain-containing sensor histidine kinase [Asticcacaulis sp. ZE23SCel15]WKL55999.1 HAMP domain-containing sensor histidine kinase [Asticcacaulis sp. ZE23SCel15]
MDYRRLIIVLGAQVGIFAFGALGWMALTRSLFASALLCGLAALALVALSLNTISLRQVRERIGRLAPGTTFTSELSRRRLQLLLDETPSPLLLQTGEQVIAVNRAARRLFDVAYTLPVASRKALLDKNENLAGIGHQLRWKGATYAVHRAEMTEADRTSFLAVLTDISADVRAAEATALRDLLRVLNHELMNALTPVASMSKSALDLLGDDTEASRSAAIRAIERVVARIEGLHNFINAYRALTYLPRPVVRTANLAEWLDVLRESFMGQWADKGVVLNYVEPPATSVLMDEDQMWLCAGNLLNNAAQAALEGTDPTVRLTVREVDDTVRLRIEDSGNGIPASEIDQIFMPFYTTKATGTGVGLSLARQIMQGHGNELVLKAPDPGDLSRLSGACFELSLKRADV